MSSVNIDQEKENAINKLEKLLEKQKSEVLQTQKLIEKLASESHLDKGINVESFMETNGLDIASSILRGADYGFISRSEGQATNLVGGYPVDGVDSKTDAFEGYGPPTNMFDLAFKGFMRNFNAIKGEYSSEFSKKITPKQKALQQKLKQLTLNSTAIWEREEQMEQIEAPIILKIPYLALCYMLDYVFEGRYVPSRFYLLETVARVPYFSYISMLHLYETLGWWRRSTDVKRVHFAEEWNEFHHLLIMESLGGDQQWWVRFMASHSAIAYYFALIALWLLSPTLGYKFSELLETHAVNTYGQFLDENEELLKELPPSIAGVEYYSFGASDPLFGEYQTSAIAKGEEPRLPGDKMKSLYDVFTAIKADEGDHVSTMKACLDPEVAVQSPSTEKRLLVGGAFVAAISYMVTTGDFAEFFEYDEILMDQDVGSLANSASAFGFLFDGLGTFDFEDAFVDYDIEALFASISALGSQLFDSDGELTSNFIFAELLPQIKQILIELFPFILKFFE